MKKSRYTEGQIAFALKQAATGTPVAEMLRQMGGAGQGSDDAYHWCKNGAGVSERTFYRWMRLYGRLGTHELRRLKQLEDENRKLRQIRG